MLYTIPNYYSEFHCVADKCPDTCCAGWQIVIDEKTLKKYKKIKGSFRKRLFRDVNWFQGTFRQDKEKRCAFLNKRNLCDLYISQGEEGFCKTCREYPRHTEEFEGVREITLSLSCPEVAGMLMSRRNKVSFLSYEKEGEEEFEEFDPFFYSILNDARKEMIGIFQKRELAMRERILLVLGMAHDMQRRMNRQEMFACTEVIEKYLSSKAEKYVKEMVRKGNYGFPKKDFAHRMFLHLYELEMLKEEWGILLKETEDFLYKGSDSYSKIQKEFTFYLEKTYKIDQKKETVPQAAGKEEKKQEEKMTDMDLTLEQLLVYFLFTYFPGAVYDGEIYAKVQFCVYCVWMIWEIWIAKWLKNDKTIKQQEMTEIVCQFSREIEHSDFNLKKIEKIMNKKWFLTNV